MSLKVLFIVRAFSRPGPQPIRFQNLVAYLKDHYVIHVLELSHTSSKTVNLNNIIIHKVQYSKIGKIFNPEKIGINTNKKSNSNFFKIQSSYIKHFLRSLLFPDSLIVELFNIKSHLRRLCEEYKYDTIVASGFPFTTMALSKYVNKILPEAKFIYDIGDPFLSSSKIGLIRNVLSYFYEYIYFKYINILVVTNTPTRNYYIQKYSKYLNDKNVIIIEMGVSETFLEIINNETHTNAPRNYTKLTYAGQFYIKLREPFELFKALKELNSLNPCSYVLDLYGTFSDKFVNKWLIEKWLQLKGRVTNDQIYTAYSNTDIIIFLDNAYGMQTPGKVFEVIAIGKPILFISDNAASPSTYIAKKYEHIVFCKNNKESIINALHFITNLPNFNFDRSTREVFSWKSRAEQYTKLISESL